MKDLIEINDNMGRNIEYSIDFFDYSDYELTIDKPTMMEGDSWLSFLNTTDRLNIPLIKISSCTKTHKLWFRNTMNYDKLVVELDSSLDNNIIEFIAKKTKYKNILLKDMKKLGCIVWKEYIDNNGFQQKNRFYVGRPSINTYTDDKLSLTISQLNKIMTGSDFEKNVLESPKASFYNFLSLKDAFTKIYNIPHGVMDNKSFPATPFRLNEETYIPEGLKDITQVGGELTDNSFIYSEDYIAGTEKNFHTQFYYKLNSPQCGYKITEYDDNGNVIGTPEDVSVMNWNVWGNTADALANIEEGYIKDMITNYQRYFRPFKIVIAGENEDLSFNDGRYRLRRDFTFNKFDFVGEVYDTNLDFYDFRVENNIWRQEEIKEESKWICESGDRLVYFEVLGDVKFKRREYTQDQDEIVLSSYDSANILYDNHSNIYVYNIDKDICYFNHVANMVETSPLPRQWLSMRDYIGTDTISWASRLNYTDTDNIYENFVSQIKPMCALSYTVGYPSRVAVAGFRSVKENQTEQGIGGGFVGEKTRASLQLGLLNVNNQGGVQDNPSEYEACVKILDDLMLSIKPKSIKISDDGQRLYFLRNFTSEFDVWDDDWFPTFVDRDDYNSVTQIPRCWKYCFKYLYMERPDGTIQPNEVEYSGFKISTYDNTSNSPIVTEVCDSLRDDSLVFINNPNYENTIFDKTGDILSRRAYVIKNTIDNNIGSEKILINDDISKITPSINMYSGASFFYWCLDNIIYSGLVSYQIYDSSYTILDFNSSTQRSIIQTNTELLYFDNENQTIIYRKGILGFEWILSMNRDMMLFTNPLENKSNIIIKVSDVENSHVRLLAFDGNRYLAGDRLACSFIKNSYYDDDGVLNIGFAGNKYELTDYDVISNSLKKYKYDILEYTSKVIQKNGFTNIETDDATSTEEEELYYDESISLSMWSNADLQLDITISRTGATELTWFVTNEFSPLTTIEGKQIKGVQGVVEVVGFNYFTFDLTNVYEGISITCDFYNTELAQGEKFRGTIDKKTLVDNVAPTEIVDVNEEFPFLDDNVLQLSFPFLNNINDGVFKEEMDAYFKYANELREFVEFTIEVPTLLFFDTSYRPFKIGSIITLSSDSKYVSGYSLDNGIITPYNENKCDYFIESMSYNISKGTTKLKLISV